MAFGLGHRVPIGRGFGATSAGAEERLDQRAGRSGRLFWKYLSIIVALVSVSCTITALLLLRAWSDESHASLTRLQIETAARAADTIQGFVGEVERQVAWSMTPVADPGLVDLDRRRDDYFRLLRQAPAIEDATYVDSTGHEQVHVSRITMNRFQSDEDLSQTRAFQEPRPGQTYFSRVYFRDGSEPHMTVSVSEPGAGRGVTVAEVNLKLIGDVIAPIRVGETGGAYVTDGDGRLIAHRDPSLVLRNTDLKSLPQVQAAISAEEQGAASEGAVTVGHDLDGREVLAAYRIIEPIGWIVFVEEPMDEAFGPIYTSIWRTTGVLAVGLLLSILVSLFLARRMVTPIRALSAGAARIGAGALDHRVEVHTGDELEVLANEINRMTERLRDLYTGLESRVAERTEELASALRELEVRTRELEIAGRHKNEFLANMSHELRTPLNSVIGFSEVLLQKLFGQLNDKQEEYLQDIRVSGEHLLALINDILDLSKVETGHMELELSQFALPETLENTLAMFRETAVRRSVSLRLSVAPDVGVITGDLRRLRQILFNLLSNALKFTDAGGVVELSARLEPRAGGVRIAVRDTGIGIALEDQERIFEAFQQSGSAREGTGLGLTLVKRLVELHGGTVSLTSAPGEGTTIAFTLPPAPPLGEREPFTAPASGPHAVSSRTAI